MGNGNTIALVETMSEDDQMKYMIQTGRLNDQMIQLYRDGQMTPREIYNYVFGAISLEKERHK
jgi:hypothetical protein